MKFAFGDGVTDTEVVVLFTRINTGLMREGGLSASLSGGVVDKVHVVQDVAVDAGLDGRPGSRTRLRPGDGDTDDAEAFRKVRVVVDGGPARIALARVLQETRIRADPSVVKVSLPLTFAFSLRR